MFRRSKELEKKKKSIKAVAIYDNLGGLANGNFLFFFSKFLKFLTQIFQILWFF